MIFRIFQKLFNKNKKPLQNCVYQKYYESKLFRTVQEYTVPTFCDIDIRLPSNVIVRPLDIQKYHNCDKLLIKFEETYESELSKIHFEKIGTKINITGNGMNVNNRSVTCLFKVPIKANLNVVAEGNIESGYFHGSNLCLESLNGNISVEKYQGGEIDLKTNEGDIEIKGPIMSNAVSIKIRSKGNIKTDKLQSIAGNLETNVGNINVDSSYCDNIQIKVNSGNVNLDNLHKNSKICLEKGHLNINGLDGSMNLSLEKGSANIAISRIMGDSKISLKKGNLCLKLSEESQKNNSFVLNTSTYKIHDNINLSATNEREKLLLKPQNKTLNDVEITCDHFSVETLSWINMMKTKMSKQ